MTEKDPGVPPNLERRYFNAVDWVPRERGS